MCGASASRSPSTERCRSACTARAARATTSRSARWARPAGAPAATRPATRCPGRPPAASGGPRTSRSPSAGARGAVARAVARELGTLGLVERDLAQADRLGRDLDALVLAQPLQRGVERVLAVGHEAHEDVGGRRADVGEVLLAYGVDVEVLGARVLPDDHPLVDLLAGPDEQRAALLKVHQRELRGRAGTVGDEGAGRARAQLAEPWL